jgi:hypothetical protein
MWKISFFFAVVYSLHSTVYDISLQVYTADVMTAIADKFMTTVETSPVATNWLTAGPLFAFCKLTAHCIQHLCWKHTTPSDTLKYRKRSTLHRHVSEGNEDGNNVFSHFEIFISVVNKTGSLARSQNCQQRLLASSLLSVCLHARQQLGSHSWISNKFSIWVFFDNLPRKFKFNSEHVHPVVFS